MKVVLDDTVVCLGRFGAVVSSADSWSKVRHLPSPSPIAIKTQSLRDEIPFTINDRIDIFISQCSGQQNDVSGNEFLFMFGDMNTSADSALRPSDAKASKGIPDVRSRFQPSLSVKA
jgi:hypothetical protein